jgi:Trypsin-co-occurring domain 1
MKPKYRRNSRISEMGRRGTMSEIVQVMLPSGEVIWVRVRAAEPAAAGERAAGPADVGLRGRTAVPAEVFRLPEFAETVRGVVRSVQQALDEHRPDSLAVEFRIEIAARSGALLSVLAEVGGTAQVKVTASWDRRDAAAPPLSEKEEADPE